MLRNPKLQKRIKNKQLFKTTTNISKIYVRILFKLGLKKKTDPQKSVLVLCKGPISTEKAQNITCRAVIITNFCCG